MYGQRKRFKKNTQIEVEITSELNFFTTIYINN